MDETDPASLWSAGQIDSGVSCLDPISRKIHVYYQRGDALPEQGAPVETNDCAPITLKAESSWRSHKQQELLPMLFAILGRSSLLFNLIVSPFLLKSTNDPVVVNHLGEAQAIRLVLRPEHQNSILLLDELAARTVAKQRRVRLSGFPGTLLMAVQAGLLSAEELRERLERCRQLGTHYSVLFIQQVYEMAKQERK